MIEVIKEKLKELDENVQYGVCKKGDTWDCLLIRKERLEKSGTSRLDYSLYVSVRIIREDVIPEGKEAEVEEKMKEAGFRRSVAPAQYDYTVDANEVVVEVCKMEFVKIVKRVC